MSGQMERLTGAIKRLYTGRHFQADAVFALLIGVVTVVEALEPDANTAAVGADTFAYVTIGVATASLLVRRHFPCTVFGIVMATLGLFYLRDGGDFLSALGLSGFYAVAAHSSDRRRAWIVLIGGTVTLCGIAWFTLLDQPDGQDINGAVGMSTSIVGTIAIGLFVRNRQSMIAESEHRASAAEADRQSSMARAVAEERGRIAREMHDVVAHGMSVIAVQAAAAQEIVHSDPDKTAEVLGRIENVGRQSLNEMRRMLGVLRNGDDAAASLAPQPSLADVPGAVEQSVGSGVATQLIVRGDVRELSPGIELTGFRVVQEALTNVLKHAGSSATATVTIEYRADEAIIDISDDGQGAVSALSGSGGGNGLIGMRERVEIYGGSLTVGPSVGGGFAVRATLPTDETQARVRIASAEAALPNTEEIS